MAFPLRLVFSGGPCGGKDIPVTAAQVQAGAISCGGTNYTILPDGLDTYKAVPSKTYELAQEPAGLPGHVQFDNAWMRLMHTLAFDVPAADQRIGAATQRIRSAVR